MSDADEVPTPALLREARGAYALAIRSALAECGLGALPANSAFIVGGLHFGVPIDALIGQRRRSLDRAGTIDALVAAGCLEDVDGELRLTERGHEAAHACGAARVRLDAHVASVIGESGVESLRAGLVALIDWKEAAERP
jgi:hypothetical protein